jgi:apolipoprotein N-acyltransferase
VVISWEVFFGGRVREGVQEGAQAVLNPTNGASYTGTIVQTQQVASSRLRAIESGRWVVQAAPTGFSAIIDDAGTVLQRSAISERTILVADVELRDGFTWYTDLGDAPFVGALIVVSAIAAWAGRRRPRPPVDDDSVVSDLDHQGDRPVVDQLDAHLGAEPPGGDRRAELLE